jgi:hypothetical protein
MPRLTRGELQERVARTLPTLSGMQVRRVADQLYKSGCAPSEWNIVETAQSGRAPGDARRVCVAPRRQKRGGPDLDPATVSDQHRADPTARLGVRNALAAARRVGA